jgi:hypothetical protein
METGRGCGTGRLVFTERRREARQRAAEQSGGCGAGTAGGGRRVELGLGRGWAGISYRELGQLGKK